LARREKEAFERWKSEGLRSRESALVFLAEEGFEDEEDMVESVEPIEGGGGMEEERRLLLKMGCWR